MGNVAFASSAPIYLGGLPGIANPLKIFFHKILYASSNLTFLSDNSTISFRGIMQDIKINNVLLDMNDAKEIQFVRTHCAPLF